MPMNFSKLQILLVTVFLCISTVQAQTTQLLTLDQAIKTGLENSKSLRISMAKLQQAQAKYDEAIDGVYPSLKLSAGYLKQSDLVAPQITFPGSTEPVTLFPIYTNNYSTRLSLSETVFSGFRLKYAMESQQFLQKAATLDVNKDRDEVAFNIIQSYFTIYKLKVSEKFVIENIKEVQEHIRETEEWEKNGIATHNEVLRWQLQESNLKLTQLDIRNNLDVANYNFNLMLGMNGDVKIEVDTNAAAAGRNAKSLQEYLQDAAQSRGDLKALEFRTNSAQQNLKVSENSYLPQITIGANMYDARPNPRVIPPKDEFKFTWDAGISLSWDLMNLYTNRHFVSETKAQLIQMDETKNSLSDAIRMEVNQHYLLFNESKEKVAVMEKAVEQSQENYRLTDSRYRNSLAIQSDLLEASSTLLQSKINLSLARADVQVAYYRLLKSTGTIN
jgi:outer membrane protein